MLLVLLKTGAVAMAGIDAVVIFGDLFDRENALFDAAVPAADVRGRAGLQPALPRRRLAAGHDPARS